MKSALTSLDIRRLVREFSVLQGRRLENVYRYAPHAYRLRFSRLRSRLVVDVQGWVYLSDDPGDRMGPDSLVQKLKKDLVPRRLVAVEQVGFDRVVRFEFEGRTLILEMFGGGNMLLLEDGRILHVMRRKRFRSRALLPGEIYRPPAGVDPTVLDEEGFQARVRASTSDMVRTLAVPLGMGAELALEVCARAGVDPGTNARSVPSEILVKVREVFLDLLEDADSLGDAYADDVTFAPVRTEAMQEAKRYPTLSACAGEFHRRCMAEVEGARPTPRQGYERIIKDQRERIAEFRKKSEDASRAAEALYSHYREVEHAMEVLRSSRGRSIPEGFTRLEGGTRVRTVLDGMEVVLDWRKDVNANAARYYEEAKRYRAKSRGAEKTIETMRERSLEDGAPPHPSERAERTFWFERYRWFITSEGRLVIAGRDAGQNTRIVRRHLRPDDIYVHADIPGAPSVVLRGGGNMDSITEACAFAVCFSRAWSLRLGSADAFWVRGDQVEMHAPPGEFLARGSFLIVGKRNPVRSLPLRLALGHIEYEGVRKVMCAPERAFPEGSVRVMLTPGTRRREEVLVEAGEALNVPVKGIERLLPGGGMHMERCGNDGR